MFDQILACHRCLHCLVDWLQRELYKRMVDLDTQPFSGLGQQHQQRPPVHASTYGAALGAFGSSVSAPLEGFAKMLGSRAQHWSFLPPPGFPRPALGARPTPAPSHHQNQPYMARPTLSPSPYQPATQQQPDVVEILEDDDDQVSSPRLLQLHRGLRRPQGP
jgi:hypothetical protein